MIKDFISATKIVRAVLRANGIESFFIYTNDYKKCKTVKTYLGMINKPEVVCEQIYNSLKDAGYSNFTFKFNERRSNFNFSSPSSFIVRLPKE